MTNNVEELVVLGNGFDLQCGLNTTYEDFFRKTLSNLEEYTDTTQDPIDFFENNIGECMKFKYLDFEDVVISEYDFSRIPKNLWYQIFLKDKRNLKTQWYQIENRLRKSLKYDDYSYRGIIFDLVTTLQRVVANKSTNSGNIVRSIRDYVRSTTDSEKLNILLIWTLIHREDVSSDIISSFISENSISRTELEEYFSNILLNDLKKMEQEFIVFLREEIKPQRYVIDDSNYNQIASRLLTRMDISHCNVVTFNYTSPFADNITCFNVHGKVTYNGINNEIIFGIDHKGIEPDSLAYRFTKNYRTLQLYSTNLHYKDYQNVYGDSNSMKKIKFYGHSLAEADYSYFQQMFDYYDLYSNNDLQLIFYYSVYDEKKEEEIRQSQFNSISKLISTYGATLDNKDKGNNLLTRLMQTGRLRLKQI